MNSLKTFFVLCLLLPLSYASFAQQLQEKSQLYDAIGDFHSALDILARFPSEVNKSGWNDTYQIKSYYKTIKKADAKIDNGIDKFWVIIEEIEKAERQNYNCSSEERKEKAENILYNLKRLKRDLNRAINDLNDLNISKISSRLFTIYKNPGNSRYKKAVIPEIQDYSKASFNGLKSIYNNIVRLQRNNRYFSADVNKRLNTLSMYSCD